MTVDIMNKVPPYGIVHDWLGPQTVVDLLGFAQSNEYRFEDTRTRQGGGESRLDSTHRVSRRLRGIGDLKKELRPKLENLLPVIFDKLGNKPFIPSGIEVQLVAHGDGAFFACHIDTATGPGQKDHGRAISAVYYFHALPKAFSGGILRLHSLAASGQEGTFADIAPDRDTLVFFPSIFPHEVLPVKCPSGQFLDSRFAVNFWIHQK